MNRDWTYKKSPCLNSSPHSFLPVLWMKRSDYGLDTCCLILWLTLTVKLVNGRRSHWNRIPLPMGSDIYIYTSNPCTQCFVYVYTYIIIHQYSRDMLLTYALFMLSKQFYIPITYVRRSLRRVHSTMDEVWWSII